MRCTSLVLCLIFLLAHELYQNVQASPTDAKVEFDPSASKGSAAPNSVINTASAPAGLSRPSLSAILASHSQWLDQTGLAHFAGFIKTGNNMAEATGEPFTGGMEVTIQLGGPCFAYSVKAASLSEIRAAIDKIISDAANSKCLKGARATTKALRPYLTDPSGLQGANLAFADLRRLRAEDTNLHGANLFGADLRGASAEGSTDLSESNLAFTKLSDSYFFGANLEGANLLMADLSGARFVLGTNLKNTNLSFANLYGVTLDTLHVAGVQIAFSTGLSQLKFSKIEPILLLRKSAKDSGLQREERELGSSIHKFKHHFTSSYVAFFEDYILGGKLTDYASRPWNSLLALLFGVPGFALVYGIALQIRTTAGIWVLHYVDSLEKNQRAVKITADYPLAPLAWVRRLRSGGAIQRFAVRLLRGVRIVRIALYVSLVSAFQLGWKDLNVGQWIVRLQTRPYTIRITGWIRTVAGIQALSSMYFLALWALTYFGNPYE